MQLPSMRKGCGTTILIDSIQIKNYMFSLLHAEMDIGIKITKS